MKRLAAFALFLGLQAGLVSTAFGFEIDEILGAPQAGELTSATGAERIAWVSYERGVRNVWTASSPDFEPRAVTDYQADDGQRISGLQLTSDGSILLYEKGNREKANPTSDPQHPEVRIHMVNLVSGESRDLVAGQGAQIAPDDSGFLYTRDGNIFLAEFPGDERETEEDAQPTPLFKSRGDLDSYSWSPNGQKIAFTSGRGDHSYIGIYDLEANTIHWLSPGVDFDSHPSWSPDGEQIAFFRTAGLRKDEMRSLVEDRKVALWVGNVQDLTAEKIWEPNSNNGFFAQLYPDQPLRWAANGRIVFYSEHEGWVHIYAIDADGEKLTNLTPGACEAEHSALSHDGDELYFSSNCQAGDALDIDRRHLWKNDTKGGQPGHITQGDSIETDPVPVGTGGRLAFRDAGTDYPTGISIINANGRNQSSVWPQSLPSDYPASEMAQPQQAIFKSADGLDIHGQLFLPHNAKAGDDRPALIFMHGGPIRQMLLGYHYRGEYYAFAYAMNQYLASQGYVVLSVNYRAGIGYGRDFRMAADQGPRGSSEYRDIVAAGKYLQSLPYVDASRIGLWGGSYGGLLTAMGLAKDSDLFAAGVDLHGVHDWSWRGRDFGNGGYWGIDESLYPLAHKSSPVHDLTYWSSPVLFIHGDDDRNVMFGQTVDLVQRLRELGVHNEVLVFPDEVHGFLLYESWLRTYLATADFFDRFLKGPQK